MKRKRSKLAVTVEFDLNDGSDSFSKFCKALIDGGFRDVIEQLGKEMLKEAKRRKLPIAKELEAQ